MDRYMKDEYDMVVFSAVFDMPEVRKMYVEYANDDRTKEQIEESLANIVRTIGHGSMMIGTAGFIGFLAYMSATTPGIVIVTLLVLSLINASVIASMVNRLANRIQKNADLKELKKEEKKIATELAKARKKNLIDKESWSEIQKAIVELDRAREEGREDLAEFILTSLQDKLKRSLPHNVAPAT